jgi:hypothetical protein
MNLIRKSAWMSLALGAAIGCAGEENASPPATPLNTAPAVGQASPPPTTKSEPAKGGMTADMMPPSAKPETKPVDSKADGPPAVEGPKTETSKSEAAGAVKLTDKELASIKKLPDEEQKQAIAQAVCPVSDHHLGSMGQPVKVTAENRTFFLCCDDCQEELKKDPKAIVAKLNTK